MMQYFKWKVIFDFGLPIKNWLFNFFLTYLKIKFGGSYSYIYNTSRDIARFYTLIEIEIDLIIKIRKNTVCPKINNT